MKITKLNTINYPEDLKKLAPGELPIVCDELREFIVEELAHNPGHLGSSLGTVELTVALHYVFNTPYDRIVWDVGHQAYSHKILTGRRDKFCSNRKKGGISGFPKRSESEYDAFGGGHSSVSISSALGMDVAAKLKGESRRTVAVIGDGAMTGGLAFEGLNNAGVVADDLLVILNDNEMSIDNNVGALNEYLIGITTSKEYNIFKQNTINALKSTPRLKKAIANFVYAIKSSILQQSNFFESLNFRYFGTVDGHDVKALVRILSDIRYIKGPKLLHISTIKGRGYKPAERSKTTWHAPGIFDMETGERIKSDKGKVKYQEVFGYTLRELAELNENIVGVTPAMPSGCSMNILQDVMPDRVFDVGIAEGHAVTFSAGLAVGGMMPFCNIYSSFMQRAYDNVIHDVVLQGVDVVLCLDRSGIVGEDGATHHGVFDIAYFRAVPQIIIAAPMNEVELRNMMYTAQLGGKGAFVIRYPRGEGVLDSWQLPFEEVVVGKARYLKSGKDIAVLSLGHVGNYATMAISRAEKELGLDVAHIDLRFAKPLDITLLHEIAKQYSTIITVEDGVLSGGVGSAILEFLSDNGYRCSVKRLGIPDRFIHHGSIAELINECGYDSEGVFLAIKEIADNRNIAFDKSK